VKNEGALDYFFPFVEEFWHFIAAVVIDELVCLLATPALTKLKRQRARSIIKNYS
jgi:hypothetical protein